MPVILKWVVSAPSLALRVSTRPEADWVSSFVVALVTAGVSAAGASVIVEVAVAPPNPPSRFDLEACTVNAPLPPVVLLALAVGRK